MKISMKNNIDIFRTIIISVVLFALLVSIFTACNTISSGKNSSTQTAKQLRNGVDNMDEFAE